MPKKIKDYYYKFIGLIKEMLTGISTLYKVQYQRKKKKRLLL